MTIVICLLSFIVGFLLGIISILGYRMYSRHGKKIKQKGYSTSERYKTLKADDEFLRSDREEHSVNTFR